MPYIDPMSEALYQAQNLQNEQLSDKIWRDKFPAFTGPYNGLGSSQVIGSGSTWIAPYGEGQLRNKAQDLQWEKQASDASYQDWVRRQIDARNLAERGARTDAELARQAAAQKYGYDVDLQRMKQQPLQQFVGEYISSRRSPQTTNLSEILNAYKGMFGGSTQDNMRGNWMTLSDILGRR